MDNSMECKFNSSSVKPLENAIKTSGKEMEEIEKEFYKHLQDVYVTLQSQLSNIKKKKGEAQEKLDKANKGLAEANKNLEAAQKKSSVTGDSSEELIAQITVDSEQTKVSSATIEVGKWASKEKRATAIVSECYDEIKNYEKGVHILMSTTMPQEANIIFRLLNDIRDNMKQVLHAEKRNAVKTVFFNPGGIMPNNNKDDHTPIMNTEDAWWYYFHGNGDEVEIGDLPAYKLMLSKKFMEHHNNIIKGTTSSKSGWFNIDMEDVDFHLGDTAVKYEISTDEAKGKCTVKYTLFKKCWEDKKGNVICEPDSFSDANLFEIMQKDDGKGPNKEFPGGHPYDYKEQIVTYTFNNPGYK